MIRAIILWLVAGCLAISGGCGSGPPTGSSDTDADASIEDRVCGEIYCLALEPAQRLFGVSSLSALDVVGKVVYTVSASSGGQVRGWLRDEAGAFVASGDEFQLVDSVGTVVPNPRGLTVSPALTIAGDRSASGSTLAFFDFDMAREVGSLDGALFDVVQDDLGIDPSGPEFVVIGGTSFVATVDRAPSGRVRFYNPFELASAGSTLSAGAEFSFSVESGAVSLFFWQRVLGVVEVGATGTIALRLLDLDASIASGIAESIDTLELDSRTVAFHELADGRIVLGFSDGSLALGDLGLAQ